MKTIIVATDFSQAASNAATYAADMAIAIHADLYLLHVYQIPVVYLEIPVALAADDVQNDAERDIAKLKEDLSARTHGQIKIKTAVREGNFLDELTTICERMQPYAVVLGSQGKTAAERIMYGAHAVQVMKHLEWPVITVPRRAKFSDIKRIGLTCDFDDVLGAVPVEEIKVLVKDFNAELHVLNAGYKNNYNPEVLDQSALLQRMLGKLIPVFHFIADENTDEGILRFAEANNIDLLIVIPRHHTLLDKLVHSSHTKQLVLHSQVPVMAFHHHIIKSSHEV